MATNVSSPAFTGGLDLTAHPDRITVGGIVLLTAKLPRSGDTFAVEWTVTGPAKLSAQDTRVALLGATTVTGDAVTSSSTDDTLIRASLDTSPLAVGPWQVHLTLTREGGEEPDSPEDPPDAGGPILAAGPLRDARVLTGEVEIEVTPKPFAAGDDVAVTLKRSAVPPTADQALWVAIRNSTNALGFDNYSRFIEAVLCDGDLTVDRGERKRIDHNLRKVNRRTALPFPNVDPYRLLKAATEVFLMTHCGVDLDDFSNVDLAAEGRRLNRTVEPGDLEEQMRDYLTRIPAGDGEFLDVVPYLGLIRLQLRDVAVVGVDEGQDDASQICYGILAEKLTNPCFLELIHEYWYDEAYVVHTLNAITWRFQNRKSPVPGRDPLSGLDIDPLRPLSNLIWSLVQDRQHRLSTVRRAYEYDHEYGLALASKPGPPVRGADSRSRFMDGFHDLLSLCSEFYEKDDHTTVIADGFGVLNALKETHLLLTEGAHNQYGDLPWTARHEMLMYQWILAQSQIREFLPTRTMVVHPERWMSSVEAMNKLQDWSDVPVLHFRDLAVFGEQLLLSIRYGAWTTVLEPEQAANWARYFRAEVRAYIHAYRAVTGVDLTKRTDRSTPAHLRRQRMRSGAYRG
jgi:hypothetical protein